jgi:hypothetical protein
LKELAETDLGSIEAWPIGVLYDVKCVDPKQIPRDQPPVGSQFNGDAKHDLEVLAPSPPAPREWGAGGAHLA